MKKEDSDKHLEKMRHSCEHVLTMAMLRLWPGKIKAAMGPATDEGYYFDFDSDIKISEDDFKKIEREMAKIVKEDLPIIQDEMTVKKARAFFNSNVYKGNEYKHEWLDDIESRNEKVSIYWMGEKGKDIPVTFVDICSGPHLESTSQIGPFKLTKVAGAYWRGDEKNKMIQRIYGVVFDTKKELKEYLFCQEEAKKRDHRKLGKDLDLFTFSDLVGAGLPMFTPRGTIIREELAQFVWSLMEPYGYQRVNIPHMAKADLYKTSGHYEKFAEDIFKVSSKMTDDEFFLKPMNCPHHTQIYAGRPRSYRDLPIRYSEVTTAYRDENTGQLQGLSRVRSLTIDDAHVFCTQEQAEEEALKMYDIVTKFYQVFDMPLAVHLSAHDPNEPDKYLGDDKLWKKAESQLEKILKDKKIDYTVDPGEAAFYGPKIDFVTTDALGRKWQLATIQLDFNLPERFELEYTDQDGKAKRPVMLHRAILGSVERFMAILIEHFAGALPLWLSPEQVRLITVSDKHEKFVNELAQEFTDADIRVGVDVSDNTVGKKIREAVKMKVPYVLVIGDNEKKGSKLNIRKRGQEDTEEMAKSAFIKQVVKEIETRAL